MKSGESPHKCAMKLSNEKCFVLENICIPVHVHETNKKCFQHSD